MVSWFGLDFLFIRFGLVSFGFLRWFALVWLALLFGETFLTILSQPRISTFDVALTNLQISHHFPWSVDTASLERWASSSKCQCKAVSFSYGRVWRCELTLRQPVMETKIEWRHIPKKSPRGLSITWLPTPKFLSISCQIVGRSRDPCCKDPPFPVTLPPTPLLWATGSWCYPPRVTRTHTDKWVRY